MEQYILEIIKDISNGKKEKSLYPCAALMSEIRNRMDKDAKDILNRLYGEGILIFHRTLNDVSFEVK